MSFEMHFVRERNLAVIRAKGQVTIGEIMSVGTTLFGSPEWRSGMNVLIDYRDTPNITDGTYDAARALVEHDQSFTSLLVGTRVAVVAPAAVVYGIVRMWEAMSEGAPWAARIFREYRPALDWLGISEQDVPEPTGT